MQPAEERTGPAKNSDLSKTIKNAPISKDGKWRHFPQDSHLLQYVSTGMFYGLIKVAGKIIRRKQATAVYTTDKMKLLDILKAQKSPVKLTVRMG